MKHKEDCELMEAASFGTMGNVCTCGDTESQPTMQELQTAWTICIELEGISGAQSQARIDLQRIRDRKRTWIGAEENKLRFALDRYLGGRE